jgi:hypothetical protein
MKQPLSQTFRKLLYSLLLQVCVLFVNLVRFLYLSRWVGVGHWTEMFLLQTTAVALPLLPVVFPTAWIILDSLGMARIQALIHMPSHSQVSWKCLLLKNTMNAGIQNIESPQLLDLYHHFIIL